MIQIPRSDLAAEDCDDLHVTRLLNHRGVEYYGSIEITDPTEVLIRIEARSDPDTVVDEALFQPHKIPTVMALLWEQHEAIKALSEFHCRLIDYYMTVTKRLTIEP